MAFLKMPYLPQSKPLFAIGDRKSESFNVFEPFCHPLLPEGLKKHADLTFCYLGDGLAVCAPESYEYYTSVLKNIPIKLLPGSTSLDRHYPKDATYNVAIVGKRIFCKKDITDRVLLNCAEEIGYKIVNMNQGYGKCSVCPIDEHGAISADMSFVKAAEKEGVEVLYITNDTISLKGYKNGFFGGSAYMENKNTLTVAGNIDLHPDSDRIKAFVEKRNIKIKSDCNLPITDFGSMIILTEV